MEVGAADVSIVAKSSKNFSLLSLGECDADSGRVVANLPQEFSVLDVMHLIVGVEFVENDCIVRKNP